MNENNFLKLQFELKLHKTNGTEFQTFFENIMKKKDPRFIKVKSGGGDGGNDGYIEEEGHYFQISGQENPSIKSAIEKMKKDFYTIIKNWDKITPVRKYSFVFNDKELGMSILFRETLSELKKDNYGIDFNVLVFDDIRDIFMSLNNSNKQELGFILDSSKSFKIVNESLNNIQKNLDMGFSEIAIKNLKELERIIGDIGDKQLLFRYDLLEAKILSLSESDGKENAEKKYKNLIIREPKEIEPILYLAEIYANDGRFDENEELLKKAEKINPSSHLLFLEKIIRDVNLKNKIDTRNINEDSFPTDIRLKSSFYRIYSGVFMSNGNKKKAKEFIEKAIRLYPNKFSNFFYKLNLYNNDLYDDLTSKNIFKAKKMAENILKEIYDIEKVFNYLSMRHTIELTFFKIYSLRALEKESEAIELHRSIIKEVLDLSFDKEVDSLLFTLLNDVKINNSTLKEIIDYLNKKEISKVLSEVLIFQFINNNNLLTTGKIFFKEKNIDLYNLIINIENKDYKKILSFLNKKDNLALSKLLIVSYINDLDLRKNILDELSDKISVEEKNNFEFIINQDIGEYKKANKLLDNILDMDNLNALSRGELNTYLNTAYNSGDYPKSIKILNVLISKTVDEKERINLKLELFDCFSKLNKNNSVIELGEEILKLNSNNHILNEYNKRALVSNILLSYIEKCKLNKKNCDYGLNIISKFGSEYNDFEFKAGLEVPLLLESNKSDEAFNSLVEGIKSKGGIKKQEYGGFFLLFIIKSGDTFNFETDSENEIKEGSFFKIKESSEWYFLGENDGLGVIEISKDNEKYKHFLGKKKNDNFDVGEKWSKIKENIEIEEIFDTENYIKWKIKNSHQELLSSGNLKGMKAINIDANDPLKAVTDFMKEQENPVNEIFNLFISKNLPFSYLASRLGGVDRAIGKIVAEKKGFIRFNNNDFEQQVVLAKDIILNKKSFYIDGTSALFLSETGMLGKINKYIPNLKSTQSIINMIENISENFNTKPNHKGFMNYSRGGIKYTEVNQEVNKKIMKKFSDSIEILKKDISDVSDIDKIGELSEKNTISELCDPCIISQKEDTPLLTDDLGYLELNKIETKKNMPNNFSSLSLMKALYEMEKITFEEYINFFSYLSSYRLNFLSISVEDVWDSVFVNKDLNKINDNGIGRLNFPLILSKEYGVDEKLSFNFILNFILKLLVEEKINNNTLKKVFGDILQYFPSNKNKEEVKQYIINSLLKIIKFNPNGYYSRQGANLINKISELSK